MFAKTKRYKKSSISYMVDFLTDNGKKKIDSIEIEIGEKLKRLRRKNQKKYTLYVYMTKYR